MHEGIQRDPQLESGQSSPKAEIIILEIAAAKLGIKAADFFHHLTAQQKAESYQARGFGGLAALFRVA